MSCSNEWMVVPSIIFAMFAGLGLVMAGISLVIKAEKTK